MSTKNDKTKKDLIILSEQLLIDFNGVEALERYWLSHSRRQIDKEFKEKYSCSYYYARKIFNEIFGFRDRSREEAAIIQHKNMYRTNLERYGRCNIGQFGTEEHTNAIKKKYGVSNPAQVASIQDKIKQTCLDKYGVKLVALSDEVRAKVKQTCIKKYQAEFPLQSPQIRAKAKEAFIQKYGVDNPSKLLAVREKIEQTNLTRYGVRQFVQSEKYQKIAKKRYTYKQISFDSSWELALWIYAEDHNEQIIRCPVSLEYTVDNKKHYYYPDFMYLGKLIEIKGKQFLTQNNRLKSCYHKRDDKLTKMKQQCMVENGVELWPYEKIQFALDYIKNKYGKNYLKQFKNKGDNKGDK